MDINHIAEEAHAMSKKKGFWDGYQFPLSPDIIAAKLALIHSEVSEALEDARDGKMETYIAHNGKPCGFPSELADIIIRIGDLAKAMGIDLRNEVIIKMAFNATRPHKHGKAF